MANFTPQEIEQMLQEFFDTVGKRQYVGARYVPVFGRHNSGNIDWDNSDAYEPLTIVYYNGDTYTSRKYVPAGIDISDTDYWVITGRYNAQVEQYRQEVLSFQGQIDEIKNDLESDYVPFPDSDHYPKYGTSGQVLSTLADGTTKWENPVVPSDAQAEEIITAWLTEHPEATTTVQDGAITWAKLNSALIDRLMHSSNKYINGNDPSSFPFDDANDQPRNSVYFISGNVTQAQLANLPIYGEVGLLIKINFSSTNADGFLQLYATNTYLFSRLERSGSGGTHFFNQWAQLYPADTNYDITLHAGNVFMRSSNIASWTFDDANEQPANTTFLIYNNVTDQMLPNLPKYGATGLLTQVNFRISSNPHGFYQLMVYYDEVYMRMETGSDDTYNFSPWRKIFTTEITGPDVNHHTCNIFRKVVCCGDSYTAGYIKDSEAEAVQTNEDYAWPHYMETITGNTYVNCGHSGATTLSWLSAQRGLPAAQSAGVAQAYIIGLMINDVRLEVPLGTIADVEDASPTTYYGGLGKIVRSLNAISNDAHIFLQTCPRTTASFQPYNQAVRNVATHYASTYNTHLLDLYEYRDLYTISSITGDNVNSHYTAIGYQQFAEILSRILSEYINAHISDFQHVYALPYV